MESMLVKFCGLLVLSCLLFENALGACTFPSDLTGAWISSRWDTMTFTSADVTVASMSNIGTNVVMNCDSSSGSKYLLRSANTMNLLGNNVEISACLDMTQLTSGVKYKYYHATTERFLVSDEQPVNLITPGVTITEADTCTVTSYTSGSEDMLVKSDQISAAAITCPDPLLANFSPYTVTIGGSTSCGSTGSINVCSHTTNVAVDYNSCSQVIYYSSGGSLNCVYYTNSGTTYYVHLMNLDSSVDNSATYYYTCLVVEYTSSPVYMSQWPRKCHASQTATSVPSNIGYTFQKTTTLTCLPGGSSSSSSSSSSIVPIIAAVVGVVVVGALTALLIYLCVFKGLWLAMPCARDKKDKKNSSRVGPDGGQPDVPTDAKMTGLTATAITTPGRTSSSDTARFLETAQSTRSAITPSNLQTDLILDSQKPPITTTGDQACYHVPLE